MWSLGVLLWALLTGTTPFTAPGDDELRLYRRIVSRELTWPVGMSATARWVCIGGREVRC